MAWALRFALGKQLVAAYTGRAGLVTVYLK